MLEEGHYMVDKEKSHYLKRERSKSSLLAMGIRNNGKKSPASSPRSSSGSQGRKKLDFSLKAHILKRGEKSQRSSPTTLGWERKEKKRW